MEIKEKYRVEEDKIGKKEIPYEAYYGIQTKRAMENFAIGNEVVNKKLIYAIATVKKAAIMANAKLEYIEKEKADVMIEAAEEIEQGLHNEQFQLHPYQGGAGTSTNMAVNEVIANLGNEKMGYKKGDYHIIHPLDHVNMSQSTNDVYPTALRIAVIKSIRQLAEQVANLQTALQEKEEEFSTQLRLGRTELMDAVPMTVGQGFGAYAKAIARDRWRIYKVEERLRHINIGGTAIGTGINASLKYTYIVTDILQDITGLGLARSEFPMDITQNMDIMVEVSGFLKAYATNLLKIANDLRLLGSGPYGGIGELQLPKMQVGSTIMPGKVNPVIPEMVGQVAMKVIANDTLLTMAAGAGQLELNPYTPLIAETLLESVELLLEVTQKFTEKCIKGIGVNEKNTQKNLIASSAYVTAISPYVGYEKAEQYDKEAKEKHLSLQELLIKKGIFTEAECKNMFSVYQITSPGISKK